MAEVTVYMRVGRTTRGFKVDARTARPNHAALIADRWPSPVPIPTAAFALKLEIPDELFDRAEQVLAEVEIPADQAKIAAEVGE
jgi:hypothetical protein